MEALPDDVLTRCISKPATTGPRELCALAMASTRLRKVARSCILWRALFAARWRIGAVETNAAILARSWARAFAAKHAALKSGRTSPFERNAYIDTFLDVGGGRQHADLAVLFLVDGRRAIHGSVPQTDFTDAMQFIAHASKRIIQSAPTTQLGVIQFSAHARTEVELAVVADVEAFSSALRAIEPLGSNTSLTAALREAEDALSTASVAGCRRIVVLLSDGRLDSYQSAQAALLCARLSRAGTISSFFALGLGDCVDEAELCRVISGADETSSSSSSGDKSNEEKGDTGAPHTAAPRCPFFWSLNARAEDELQTLEML